VKILLTGRNGQVGWELERSLAGLGEVSAFDVESMDLAIPDQIVARLQEIRPDVIVNAAAYTAVDAAEEEPELAMAINGTAPGVLAEEAKRLGSLLVHYSTDYVFDGTKCSPYGELDVPNPVNVYGRTKLAGEEAIRGSGCRHLVLRLAWVYSGRGKNFLLTMCRLADEKPELRVVSDQTGAPTWARDIAEATTRILRQQPSNLGTYHLTASGQTTWFGFAKAIMDLGGLSSTIVPITSSEYPTAASRPSYSVLDNTKLFANFGLRLRPWEESLANCLHVLKSEPGW
jgi:dTDP-4-dehydrorhamnose reductase